MPGDLQRTWIVFELDIVPTEGTRLPSVRSGDFGSCRFLGSSRQAMRLTVYGRYTDFGLRSLGLNVRFGS